MTKYVAGQYCTVTAYSLYLSVTRQRDGQNMKHGQGQIGVSHEVVGHLKQSDLLEDVNIDGIIKPTFEKGLSW